MQASHEDLTRLHVQPDGGHAPALNVPSNAANVGDSARASAADGNLLRAKNDMPSNLVLPESGTTMSKSEIATSSSPSHRQSHLQDTPDETRDANSQSVSEKPAAPASEAQLPRQIPHLIHLTEEVLTKRVLMQNEEELLQGYQAQVNTSSMELMAQFTESIVRIRDRESKKLKKRKNKDKKNVKVSKGDVDAILVPPPPPVPPTPTIPADSTFYGEVQSAGLEDSGVKIAQTVETNLPKLSPGDYLDSLLDKYRKFQNDYEALNLQRVKLSALRNELTALEYRLQRRQDEFRIALESMVSTMPGFAASVLADASQAMGSFASSERSKSDTPTLLAAYFDRKGDVGIWRDRLSEAEYHFQEGLLEREFIRDREDTLDITDEEFEAQYREKKASIEKELHAIEQDVAHLAARCHAAGIDVINTARRASSFTTASDQVLSVNHEAPAVSLDRQGRAGISAGTNAPHTVDETSAWNHGKDRVRGWLHNMPAELEAPAESQSLKSDGDEEQINGEE